MPRLQCPNPDCKSTEGFQVTREWLKSRWWYVDGNGEPKDGFMHDYLEEHAYDLRCEACDCEENITQFLVEGSLDEIDPEEEPTIFGSDGHDVSDSGGEA